MTTSATEPLPSQGAPPLRTARTRQASRAAWVAFVGVCIFSKEAVLGTYGSYSNPRRGYTLSVAINIGSHSDHSREAPLLAEKQTQSEQLLQPLVSRFDAWVERPRAQKHPYGDWLAALDWQRTKALPWDYISRLPAPIPRPTADYALSPLSLPSQPELYLHMKPQAPNLARGRALVGFALAQAFLGDTPDLTLPDGPKWPLAERLRYAATADSYSGQPRLLAALILAARGRDGELLAYADDPTKPPHLRLLAGLIGQSLRAAPLSAASWQQLDAAKSAADRRTLWTWMLTLTPAAAQPQVEQELRQRLPLASAGADQDKTDFYREFIRGSRE